MTSPEKDNSFFEQLSAYLDGELSPGQAAKLEQRLADDPAARAMLDEFRQISGQIGSLPRERVPESFPDQVLREIERDVLLSDAEAFAETAGRNHLFLRRIVAAAAVIMLTGSIGFIVYSVLFKTPDDFFKPNPSEEPVIAVNRPMRERPETLNTETKPVAVTPPKAVDKTESGDKALAGLDDYSCSSVELAVYTGDDSTAGTMVDDLLSRNGIDQHICSTVDTMGRQYAFVCSPEKLRTFFKALNEQTAVRVDMVLTDSRSTSQLLISNVRQDQLMALAAQNDQDKQFAMALEHRWGSLTPTGETMVADASSSTHETLPDWLSEMIVQTEPEMTDLRSLGVTNETAGPVCPPGTLEEHHATGPTLSANKPAGVTSTDQAESNRVNEGAFIKKTSEKLPMADRKAITAAKVHCVAVILNVHSDLPVSKPTKDSPQMNMPCQEVIGPVDEPVPGGQPIPSATEQASPSHP